MIGWQKGPIFRFPPVISLNIGMGPENSRTFSSNPFWCTLVNLRGKSLIIELEARPPLKKIGFSGQILIRLKIGLTSFIEI